MPRRSINLTQNLLKTLLDYNPVTGLFVWKIYRSRGARKGQIVSTRDSDGYVTITIGGRRYFAHRLAWLYVHGYWPIEVDHRNGIVDANWIENLRDCSHADNQKNQKLAKNNTSGYRGVTKVKKTGKFMAQIEANGHHQYLGVFKTAQEAAAVYEAKAEELFGEFRRIVA